MIRIIIAQKLAKIILVPPKYEITFGVLSYCDNNVGPFSIAPNSVIAKGKWSKEIISNISKEEMKNNNFTRSDREKFNIANAILKKIIIR